MKKYTNLLFDLDGTIIDSQEGIINSARYALKHFGIEDETDEELYKFIGPPLYDSFRERYGFDEEKTEEAVKEFRVYYQEKGVYESSLYEGITEMLKELKEAGKKIVLATSKAEPYAIQILKDNNIYQYFDFICGSTMDDSRSKKADIINYILEQNDFEPEDTVMIGDKKHDVIGAKQTNLDSVGVLYGFGDYEELSNAGATYIVKDVKELRNELMN